MMKMGKNVSNGSTIRANTGLGLGHIGYMVSEIFHVLSCT